MAGWRLPPGKISLSLKTIKNNKIADALLTINGFYD